MLTRCTFLLLSTLLLLAAPAAEASVLRPVLARRQTRQTERPDVPLPAAPQAPQANPVPRNTTAHRPYRPAPAHRPPPTRA